VFATNRADHHVSLLQSVLGAEKDMLRSPERLRFNKVDPVLRLVALALSRVKLEIHDVDRIRAMAAATTKHQSTDHSRPTTDCLYVNVQYGCDVGATNCISSELNSESIREQIVKSAKRRTGVSAAGYSVNARLESRIK
jgi:hypothetical protein